MGGVARIVILVFAAAWADKGSRHNSRSIRTTSHTNAQPIRIVRYTRTNCTPRCPPAPPSLPHLQAEGQAAQVLAISQVRLISCAGNHHHRDLAVFEEVGRVGAALADLEHRFTVDAWGYTPAE